MATPARPSPRTWRHRWQQWWLHRLGRSDRWVLNHRNVYILPTRAGIVLGVTLLVLLVASINYQLSLGYLLTFLLAGATLAAMHATHRNLRGLEMHLQAPQPVHAGDHAMVPVHLHNPGRHPRYAITVSWYQTGGTTDAAWTDVPPGDRATCNLGWQPPARGRQMLPTLRIESGFPLGVFRAWSWWRPAAQALVYPRPETPCPPWPEGVAPGPDQTPPTGHEGGHRGASLRPYRHGDPLKTIAWKLVARRDLPPPDGWVSRESEPATTGLLWLDSGSTGLTEREAQASRLCAWVLNAESLGLDYGLRLPQRHINPDHGPVHQHRCLEALALW